MLKNNIVALFLSLFLTSCSPQVHNENLLNECFPNVIQHIESDPPFKYGLLWLSVVSDNYKDPLVFVAHGRNIDGRWYTTDISGKYIHSVEYVVDCLIDKYGNNKNIFLIICNDKSIRLKKRDANVYYALNDVWVVPTELTPVDIKFFRIYGPLNYCIGFPEDFIKISD